MTPGNTQGLLPLLALHSSTDGSIVRNDIGHNSGCCNTAPNTLGLLPLQAHLTITDGGIVGNDILLIITSTDGGIVGNERWAEPQSAASTSKYPKPAANAGQSHQH